LAKERLALQAAPPDEGKVDVKHVYRKGGIDWNSLLLNDNIFFIRKSCPLFES
jgi:hypothetical protein